MRGRADVLWIIGAVAVLAEVIVLPWVAGASVKDVAFYILCTFVFFGAWINHRLAGRVKTLRRAQSLEADAVRNSVD